MENSQKIRVRAKLLLGADSPAVWVQRAPRKWWRRLGEHQKTDDAFWYALFSQNVEWIPVGWQKQKIF